MPVIDITKEQLKEKLSSNPDNLEIIDVREPDEYDLIHLKNSKLIPMNELVSRIAEIDWNKEVVFICRSGSRSKMMALFVASQTGKNIENLDYGIIECFQDAQKCHDTIIVDEENIGGYF